jgi:hypothetical protein
MTLFLEFEGDATQAQLHQGSVEILSKKSRRKIIEHFFDGKNLAFK